MKKRLSILLIIMILFIVTGCSSSNNVIKTDSNRKEEKTVKKQDKITIDNIESKIRNLGIQIEKTEAYYDMIGAENGFKLNSGDSSIEIYKFDKNSEVYKTALNTQKISMGEDFSFDAVVKNGYAYTIDESFPDYSEVIMLLEQLE